MAGLLPLSVPFGCAWRDEVEDRSDSWADCATMSLPPPVNYYNLLANRTNFISKSVARRRDRNSHYLREAEKLFPTVLCEHDRAEIYLGENWICQN